MSVLLYDLGWITQAHIPITARKVHYQLQTSLIYLRVLFYWASFSVEGNLYSEGSDTNFEVWSFIEHLKIACMSTCVQNYHKLSEIIHIIYTYSLIISHCRKFIYKRFCFLPKFGNLFGWKWCTPGGTRYSGLDCKESVQKNPWFQKQTLSGLVHEFVIFLLFSFHPQFENAALSSTHT